MLVVNYNLFDILVIPRTGLANRLSSVLWKERDKLVVDFLSRDKHDEQIEVVATGFPIRIKSILCSYTTLSLRDIEIIGKATDVEYLDFSSCSLQAESFEKLSNLNDFWLGIHECEVTNLKDNVDRLACAIASLKICHLEIHSRREPSCDFAQENQLWRTICERVAIAASVTVRLNYNDVHRIRDRPIQ
jgi:hypothetical protein